MGGKSGPKWPHFNTLPTVGITASVPENLGLKNGYFLRFFTIFAPRVLWGVARTVGVGGAYILFLGGFWALVNGVCVDFGGRQNPV